MGRSREGAWIEMAYGQSASFEHQVAPVRERGLKFFVTRRKCTLTESRSREGAWIEINSAARHAATVASRSREGAWIEMAVILRIFLD